MNPPPRQFNLLLLVATWLLVYLSAAWDLPRNLLGVPLQLLPALAIYAALRGSIGSVLLVTLCGGLWLDSLSATPLGVSTLPLLVVGILLLRVQELVLRDLSYAQWILGLMAGGLTPLLTWLLLQVLDQRPMTNWWSLWSWFLSAATNGVGAPILFRTLDWVQERLFFSVVPEPAFRADREIIRGRGHR